jgi:hypothetical protein
LSVDEREIARYRMRAVQLVPVSQPDEGRDAEEE